MKKLISSIAACEFNWFFYKPMGTIPVLVTGSIEVAGLYCMYVVIGVVTRLSAALALGIRLSVCDGEFLR